MGYCTDNSVVRVDFFKKSGKWYATRAVDMNDWYHHPDIFYAVAKSIINTIEARYVDMIAVMLEPYHVNSHPIMISVDKCRSIINANLK